MMISQSKISVLFTFFLFGTILSVWGGELPKFEDFRPNRPVLDLPVVGQKIVLAHFMTGAFVRDSQFRDRFLSYEDFTPDGITANVGGESQILPIDYYFNFKKSSVEAAAFHIKAAKKLGIDGFQFFYPFPPGEVFQRNYNNIIIDFFKAAETAGVDFKFSLCFCGPPLNKSEDEKIEVFAKGFREILDAVGEDNKFWMKTPDGRFLTYLWAGDMLTDAVREAGWDFRKKADTVLPRIAYAYEKLSHKIGIDQAYIYQIRWIDDPNYIQRALEYFPAVWNWTENRDNKQAWLDLAKLCKEKKRTFSQGVYPDYYGSKLYKKSQHDYEMYHFLKDVQKLKTDDVEHDYYYMGITDVYLDYLKRILETETPLISFITYNDYAEGHHVAPEVNHQFGFAVLFNHYKNIWQGHSEKNNKEFAVLAYKKYRHDLVPEPYNIEFRGKNNKQSFEPESDDFIHIVTFLKQPAAVFLNGHKIADAEGKGDIEVFKVPMRPGKVELRIDRKNETVIRLTGTEWITEKPFRTDRLTYCISSECDQYYSEIFGNDAPRYFLQQYAEDETGIPFWKQGKSIGVRYSDGKTGTATTFEPNQSPEWH
jgi:hypothetical protein